MLPALQVILFLICPIIENFKKIFMHYLAIGYIIIYRFIIILNVLNKVAHCIKFRILESW